MNVVQRVHIANARRLVDCETCGAAAGEACRAAGEAREHWGGHVYRAGSRPHRERLAAFDAWLEVWRQL